MACDIVVPVYNAFEALERCVRALERNAGASHRVILVDDASTDPRVGPLLRGFASRRPGTLVIENPANLGFVGAVNAALAHTHGDVVLLNADTVVTSGWLEAMLRCRQSAPRIGIVCPLSNNATLLTIAGIETLFGRDEQEAIAACVRRAGPPAYPRIPTAVGFCMLITREVLDAAAPLDIAYARGYGEENDLSMRALELGFEIACCDDAYLHHEGEASFKAVEGITQARERNRKLLERRWPAYRPGVSAWMRANPLRPVIERINAECERSRMPGRPRVLHVVHAFDTKGGVEGHTRAIIDALSEEVAFNVAVATGPSGAWADFIQERPAPHLRISRLNQDLLTPGVQVLEFAASVRDPSVERAFTGLLAGGFDVVHFHSPLGWNTLRLPELARQSGARVVISVHDMGWMCAEYNMVTGPDDRPCGRIVARGEAQCVTCLRGKSFASAAGVGAISAFVEDRFAIASAAIRDADAIVCPSQFVVDRVTAAFGGECAPKLRLIGHGVRDLPRTHASGNRPLLKVAFVGRFTARKGAHHFIEAARRLRGERIAFEAWGSMDQRLQAPAQAAGITLRGPYELEQLPGHLAGVDLVMMPSTLEETFCLALSEVHAIGVPVAAARSGAMPERVREGDNGFLFDVGDIDAMRSLLVRIRDDRSLLARVAERVGAERPKTTARNAQEYLELYRELAALPRPPMRLALPSAPPMEQVFPRAKRSRTPLGDAAYDRWLESESRRDEATSTVASIALVAFPPGASAASINRQMAACETEWIALTEEGDTLADGALAILAREAAAHPGAALLYGDHDAQSLRGERYDPAFKPAFSRELLRHRPYVAGLCAIRRERWLSLGGFRAPGWAGVVEFALRLAELGDAQLVRPVREILVHRLDVNDLALDEPTFKASMKEGVAEHLRRSGARPMHFDTAIDAPAMWAHQPARTAPISVFLRCTQPVGGVATCLDALVRRSGARIGEVFVDMDETQAAELGRLLARRFPAARVHALEARGGAALAEAFRRAGHDWLAVIDSRLRSFTGGWLERLEQGIAGRSTAAIAPDLVDAAGRHVPAWQLIGGGAWSVAGTPPAVRGDDALSLMYASPREVSCVSPFLSLWRVEVAARIPAVSHGVANAGRFDIAHLCLGARDRGYDLLARPFIAGQLAIFAGSPDPFTEDVPDEVAWMRDRWRTVLDDDPFFHPMLALTAPRIEPAPRFAAGIGPRLKICAFPFDRWACGEMRVRQPCAALEREGLASVIVMDTHETGRALNRLESRRMGADTVLAHNFFHDYQLQSLAELGREARALRVLGMDDLLTALPPGNTYAATIYPDIARRIAKAVSLCDRLVVSTPELADAYGGRAEVHVIANALDPIIWSGLQNRPRGGPRPRVGWAGAKQHLDDLRLLEPVVAATAKEIDWVFLGMCTPELRRHAGEVHEMAPIAQYPAKLASLGLDAAVAPLVDHPFNRAKSGLKVLEYGVLGIPVVASDVGAYRTMPVTLVAAHADRWIDAIRALVADRSRALEIGMVLRQWVLANGMLPSMLPIWRRALGREG